MAELSVFEKAKKELEDFYLGVSEESKELSFKDLAQAKQQEASPSDEKKESGPLDPASETNPSKQEDFYLVVSEELLDLSFKDLVQSKQQEASPLDEKKKSGPLDPTSETNPRKQEQSSEFHHIGNDSNRCSFRNHRSPHHASGGNDSHASRGPVRYPHREEHHGREPPYSSKRKNHSVSLGHRHVVPHAPLSPHIVMVPRQTVWTPPQYVVEKGARSPRGGAKGKMNPQRGEGARRGPGIPQSSICTICCNYIFVFRRWCLVCGRAYCRRCVRVGMGEMTEGSKCIECLGKKIQPKVGTKSRTESVLFDRCSCSRAWTMVMQQELKPAGKGPRKSVEK